MAEIPEPLSHTVIAIWEAYEKRIRSNDSLGIPASQVNNECLRAVWYAFRWASPAEHTDGQKQRRFDTGSLEEERLLDDLVAANIDVERLDPATGQQFRISLADGWLRGKLDGKAINIPEAPKTLHVVECKSHNDKSYKDLIKRKLRLSKPDHFAQCQIYMLAENLTRCLYIAVNKNTDEIYIERIEIDKAYARSIEDKARRIVKADKAPPRLFADPTDRAAFQCQWCNSKAQCHEGQFSRINCRTCISCSFQDNAVVYCEFWQKELNYNEQQAGCEEHRYLPSLVPGEQIDANEQERTVTYKLNDGSVWVDK